MKILLPLLCCFLYFNCHAHSYLGKTKKEVFNQSGIDFEDGELSYSADAEQPFIKIVHGYETLYYYFENDTCVKFKVVKPYSCNCLETDIQAYQKHCIPLGELKWISQDQSKIYEMSLMEHTYSLSIVPNSEKLLDLSYR